MISVIVPIYNTEQYLEASISSICKQTYCDIEIICVNDGSTDRSGEILQQLAEKDPRIHIYYQPNGGVSSARNLGLCHAAGEYIYFPDSDDMLAPELLENLLSLILEHGCDVSMCGYRKHYLDGSTKDILGTRKLHFETHTQAINNLLCGKRYTGSLCTKLFRRNVIEGLQFRTDISINEDILFCFYAFQQADCTVFLDIPLYHYYERATASSSRNSALKKAEDALYISDIIFENCKNSPNCSAAAEKLFLSATGAYRTFLFYSRESLKKRKTDLIAMIQKTQPWCQALPKKYKFNYLFLRYAPSLYKLMYSVYDHIRTPNWDL